MASYRYRCEIPAKLLGASINDLNADVLVFSKPTEAQSLLASDAILNGKRVVVDFCDDHFITHPHYRRMAQMAHGVICPTEVMRLTLASMHIEATVIPDCYESGEELAPHCNGKNVLWFGHAVNIHSIKRVIPSIENLGFELRIVSNYPGCIPWSAEAMKLEFKRADIVIVPATAAYKSNNRTLEAIRAGCFVVAEPHPALADIPGIYVGTIAEGIQWAVRDCYRARQRTAEAQVYIRQKCSPTTMRDAWSQAVTGSDCISAAEKSDGLNGSISILDRAISTPTFDSFDMKIMQPKRYAQSTS